MRRCGWIVALVVLVLPVQAEDTPYQLPPKAIADVVNAPAPPSGFVNSQEA
ncbi:MAG: hypothetical protein M5R36_05005 [Deltaproteobacteria bacterium]|nr:hypothetical protein [Deltaproteobacteria bacterium]